MNNDIITGIITHSLTDNDIQNLKSIPYQAFLEYNNHITTVSKSSVYDDLHKLASVHNIKVAPPSVIVSPEFITKVIFNYPATIIYWGDGTKTVVKVKKDEEFDPEKGLAIAICKKMFGNGNSFRKICKKWIPEESEKGEETVADETLQSLVDDVRHKLLNMLPIKRNADE